MLPIPNPYILQAGIRDLVRMLPQWEGLPVEGKDSSVGNEDSFKDLGRSLGRH